jgi:signal transduction histidine kinase
VPMFELQATRAGRYRVFLRAQLPLLVGAAFVAVSSALAVPGSLGSSLAIAGLGVIALASVAALLVPWEKTEASWMILVAVADMVGVAFMRAELFTVIPSVGMLVIFPVLWLSYGFGRGAVAIAIAGTVFVTLFTFVANGIWPSTGAQWLSVVTLPVLIAGVAVVVNIAATHLRRNLLRLAEANREQAATMRIALDNEILARSILDTVNAGVAFYSASDELILSNEHARQMTAAVGFALDAPPYAGDNVLAADRATPIPFDQQIIPRALRGELIEDHVEWLGPPGQQVAIMATSRQAYRPDGTLLGTVIMAYDITELASAVAVREEFLGTVSHELRTPLTSVVGYLELIADDLLPSQTDIQGYLEVVQRNVAKLADRIDDMHGAAQTDILLHTRATDLTALVATCVERATERAGARGVTVENTVVGGEPVSVDPAKASQALGELLANAIKFSPAGSTVTIARTDTADGVELAVLDRGPSMTRAERARAFDRFYRTQYARDQAVQGFGLGLFVVKNIMDAHGGRVTVGGSPETGTTATLLFPTAPA